jgi:hypothetical protein
MATVHCSMPALSRPTHHHEQAAVCRHGDSVTIASTGVVEPKRVRSRIVMLLALAGTACSITLVFLAMRSVMKVGGACADGGPFVVAQPCPKGVPALLVGGIFGGLLCAGLSLSLGAKHNLRNLAVFAWPALFLSLGYNFLDFGLNPPRDESAVWGWLVCAAVFALMGGLPLIVIFRSIIKNEPIVSPSAPMRVTTLAGDGNEVTVISNSNETSVAFGGRANAPMIVSELERLVGLRASGALTDDQFNAAMTKLLNPKGEG